MKLKGEIHLFLIRLAFLLVFLWVLFGLLFGITTMKNNDMSPRISAGDLLFYYRLEKPKSGDVVVLQKAGEKYVGRVIAAGGDTVEITEDEKVKINGSKIVENDILRIKKLYIRGCRHPKRKWYFFLRAQSCQSVKWHELKQKQSQ